MAEVWTLIKRKKRNKPACVNCCSQYMGGIYKKGGLKYMYLVKRQRMKKWNITMFRSLQNITVLSSVIMCKIKVELKV